MANRCLGIRETLTNDIHYWHYNDLPRIPKSIKNRVDVDKMEQQILEAHIVQTVRQALQEDLGLGDATASLIDEERVSLAQIISREPAIVCGQAWAERCFFSLDPHVDIQWQSHEGTWVAAGQTLCTVRGKTRALLSAERCALNFLQTLSATATITRHYVEAVAGTQARILDTRKTLPMWRLAQKYAVTVGGGLNQRIGLYDGILIKENHIAASGGIPQVLALAKAKFPMLPIQIEVETLDQLEQALEAGAVSILLDNFSLALLHEAVRRNARRAILEASGGITLANVHSIALTGVDRISVGSLTKHVQAIDLSMRLSELV